MGSTEHSMPAAERTGRATVREQRPTPEISCIASTRGVFMHQLCHSHSDFVRQSNKYLDTLILAIVSTIVSAADSIANTHYANPATSWA